MPEGLVYVGTYTRQGHSDGIQVFNCDPSSGGLTWRSRVAARDASFLCFDNSRRVLFATSEGLTADQAEAVSFAINPQDGTLTTLSQQPTRGGEPCHLCVDPSNQFLLIANHENGTVIVFPFDASGRLAQPTDFVQHPGAAPHAHHVTFDPNQQRVLVTDKGIDTVMIYRLDVHAGKLRPNEPPGGAIHRGAQPRHLAFSRDGRFAYVNGEADMTLSACSYDSSTGALQEFQVVSTLPEGTPPNADFSTAEVAVGASGRHVYVSNRGHNSIVVFAIDPVTGRLELRGTVPTGGKTPRHFAIHPNGKWLYAANQDSDTIVQFEINPDTGGLQSTGNTTEVGAPVCILFG